MRKRLPLMWSAPDPPSQNIYLEYKGSMRALCFFVVALILLGTLQAQAFMGLFGGSMENAVAKDGLVTVNTSFLKPGHSKHYQYTESDTNIRFFLVRDTQGGVRAALDACEACWRADKGYRMQDHAMLCVNCGQKFDLTRIGLIRGGCNPHPIVFRMDGEIFTVTAQELLAGSRYFPENGR